MRKHSFFRLIPFVVSAGLFLGCLNDMDEELNPAKVDNTPTLRVIPAVVPNLAKGKQQRFTAYLNGNIAVSVSWKLSGNSTEGGSVLANNGLLTVGSVEEAKTLTVSATVRVGGKNVSARSIVNVIQNTGGSEDDADSTTPVSKSFFAINLETVKPYTFTADLLAESDHCKVWVERASQERVDSATAYSIAHEYDNRIYGIMMDAFDIGPITVGENNFTSVMEYADWLTDNDGKLSILMLDIQDGSTSESGSYTAGYFYPADFLAKTAFYSSNETDMIYMDTYPAVPGGEVSMMTLAHELQHLMNYAVTVTGAVRNNRMDIWIDEGLSSAAEYLYLESNVTERYEWFNEDYMGTIAKGNNFFVWGNLQNTSILDDYATAYLFFQWLRVQSGGTGIYKNIIGSEYYNYRAVTAAAKNKISWFSEGSSWEWKDIFVPWLAANYINAESGKYGYKNDDSLKGVKAKTAPGGTFNLQLLPGEAVYSKTVGNGSTSVYASGSGTNIRYAGLKKDGNGGTVSGTNTYSDGALLTYNVSTSSDSGKETGRLTGTAEVNLVRAVRNILGLSAGGLGGPVRIDARDMLAINGHGDEADIFNDTEVFERAMPDAGDTR